MIRIHKPDPSRDYVRDMPNVSEAQRDVADAWHRAAGACGEVIVALHWIADEAHLVRAWVDGADTSRRPVVCLVAERVEPAPEPPVVPGLLTAAFARGKPSLQGNETATLTPSSLSPREDWCAAAVLACDDDAKVLVASTERAAWVLERTPRPRWVAMCNRAGATSMPAGAGLLISTAPWLAPEGAAEAGRDASVLATLLGLKDAGRSRERRWALIRQAATASPSDDLGGEPLSWVWRTTPSRDLLWSMLTPEQQVTLVEQGEQGVDALAEQVAERMTERVVRSLPSRVPPTDALHAAIARRLGPDAEELRGWLPPRVLEAERRWLDERVVPPSDVLHLLHVAGRLHEWPLHDLAPLARDVSAFHALRDRFVQDGVPREVVEVLLDQASPPEVFAPWGGEIPVPLAALSTARSAWMLLRTMDTLEGWRGWVPLAEAHEDPDATDTPSASLAILLAHLRDPASGDRAFARWSARHPADSKDLCRLLGLEVGTDSAPLTGLPSLREKTPPSTWARLVRSGFVERARAVQHLLDDRGPESTSSLEAIGVSSSWVATLRMDAAPPSEVPAAPLPADIRPLLDDRTANGTWWKSWRGRLTRVDAERLSSSVDRIGPARAAVDALDGLPVAADELACVIGALPPHVLVVQALDAAGAGDRQRLHLVLREGGLPHAVASWLEDALVTGNAGPPPSLTPILRLAMLPVLHPVREVLVPLLEADVALPPVDGAPWRALLERLREAHLVPLRPPAGAFRHPEHLASVSSLLTWRGWALPESP